MRLAVCAILVENMVLIHTNLTITPNFLAAAIVLDDLLQRLLCYSYYCYANQTLKYLNFIAKRHKLIFIKNIYLI